MFKDNKYSKVYFSIIERAKQDRHFSYMESHHIIPKCLGGSDDASNIVRLTAREHFVCHMLLTKMHDDYRLKYALVAMSLVNPNQDKRHRLTSWQYEYVKKCNSLAASERMGGHPGHNLGRVMAHNDSETRFFSSESEIPVGWVKGHNPKTKASMRGKNSGKIYYHNPNTGEVKTFIDPPPPPWIKGNPRADTSDKTNIKGTSYYHNPNTGEECRSISCPEGWIRGRVVIWINDGTTNKQHNKTTPIPKGWMKGRITKWKER